MADRKKQRTVGGVRQRVRPPAESPVSRPLSITEQLAAESKQSVCGAHHGPHPDALTFAAWYVATVICDLQEHAAQLAPDVTWPCDQCMKQAELHMHSLPVEISKGRGK